MITHDITRLIVLLDHFKSVKTHYSKHYIRIALPEILYPKYFIEILYPKCFIRNALSEMLYSKLCIQRLYLEASPSDKLPKK